MQLPKELKYSKYVLVSIKNKDNEYFRCCYIRYLNHIEKYPQRINKTDKKWFKNGFPRKIFIRS